MKHPNYLHAFILLVLVTACSKPLPELKAIDVKWKKDRNGCLNYRATKIDGLRADQDKFLGLDEMEIVSMLGRPDQNELYKRNQKFYYYYLQPGPGCESEEKKPLRLMVRFNAVGLAKEVSIE